MRQTRSTRAPALRSPEPGVLRAAALGLAQALDLAVEVLEGVEQEGLEDPPLGVEVAQTGDFEAQVTWVIGLDNEHPFTVTASNDELVVEISQ